jgi:amino acid adenylation domain-containing protein/non-ribosomal peptide synthase protein (TIGR01720 family)/FkbM family methyltransferase
MSEGVLEGFRMSPPQDRLWTVWRTEPGAAYNAACAVLVEGALDAARLRAALTATVARHEILRTGFECPQGMTLPLQVIGDGACPPLVEEDLTGLGASAQEERAAAHFEASAREPFDFGRGPLLRLSLLKLSERRHALVLVLPALCADHAACQNLVREVARAYEESERDDEEIQYADLSEWQNELLESEETRAGRDYWRAQPFADPRGARLPYARGERAVQGFSVATHRLKLDAELTRAIERQSEKAGVPAELFLQACWHILLSRMTGQAGLVVGVYGDGRKYEELDAALGPFAKFLPASIGCGEGARFEDLLRQADEVGRGLGRWQEYFTWEDWAAGRGDGQGFFPLCFEYADVLARAEAGGLAFSTYAQRVHVDRFELKLSCLRRGEELLAEFHLDESVYGREDVGRLAAQYLSLLKSAADNPARTAAELNVLGDEERGRLLVEFNRTGGAPAESLPLVHRLIEERARLAPLSDAVTCGGLTLTYGELDARAERLAARLRESGLQPEGRVGVCLERSAEAVVCMLAVWKAGGAYVPLEPEQPAERLAFMLEDAGVSVVLTRARLLERVAASQCEVIDIDADAESTHATSVKEPATLPENLAYILYTSGSTGRPKGVAVEHRQLAHYVDAVTRRLALPQGATFAAVTTLAADLAYTSVFPALSTGGHLHVVGHEVVADAAVLADYFERNQIDCVKLVPSLMTALLASPEAARLLPRRVLVLGGEASVWGLVERVRSLAPTCEVFNHYGPTESTVGVLTYRAGEGAARPDSPTVPLGAPLERVRAYVLDAGMRPVPTGLAGELYLGGAGLARGYLNRPALTAERFVPDPFGGEPGARLYRTGDLVRFLADGTLGFLGRIDDQLKIRGFRVEAGEVEAALRAHPGVRAGVVLPRADASGVKRLVAYFVADGVTKGGGRERYRLPNGLSIVQQNRNETDHGYKEIFEEQSYLRHGVSVEDGDCVFDVGANIGLFSLFVGRTRPRARVYAFEPVAPVYDLLRTNAALHCPNVKALHVGLSDRERAEEFTYYPGYTVMSGASAYADAAEEIATIKTILRNRQAAGDPEGGLLEHAEELIAPRFAGESVRCRLRALSDVIEEENVGRIDLLKVDVQRAELDVLRGIREEHWGRIGQVVMEVHDGEGRGTSGRVAEVTSMLEARGFRVAAEQAELYRGTDRHTLYATRPEVNRQTRAAEVEATPVAVVNESEVFEVTEESLTNFLRERLPEYMIPSAFVRLDALPLTPNGKVNREELPSPPEPGLPQHGDDDAPTNSVEAALASVWASVLGVERVGIHDNFFRLGGDSIMSIQVVARAGQEGVRITARQLFENPTVAGLAAVANTSADARAEQGPVVGPVPLTPIQRWFFDADPLDPHHWNMALMLEAGEPLDAGALGVALRALLAQHDALRLRFESDEPGIWRQSCGETSDVTPLTVFDLSTLPRGGRIAALEEAAARLQGGLELAGGSLLRCALFRLGEGESDRLLFVVHHLGIDGVSWRILLEDLRAAYAAAAAGARAQLPPKTTSFRRWAEGLKGYAQEPRVRAGADYWLDARRAEVNALRTDGGGGPNTYADSSTVTAALDAEQTRALLQDAQSAYNTEINDILLAALARAFAAWTGEGTLLVDLEGHGREEVLADTDFSRTVGCFTTRFPVLLELGGSAHPGEELKGVKERLRRVPQRGLDYGVLRYLSDDEELAAALARMPQPEVSFNYLGQLDQLMPGLGPFAPARESSGPVRSERALRRHSIEVNCWVADGRLETVWRYGASRHRRDTIEALARGYVRALSEIVEHCLSPGAGGYSASDFEEFGWSQEDLDDILSKINGPAA